MVSPIIVKTKRVINYGNYGKVNILSRSGDCVEISMGEYGDGASMNVEELREAAHLFNQLAEFLESKEDD